MPNEAKAQQRFFNILRSKPEIQLILGRLEKRRANSGEIYYVEKGVDVMIAKDIIVDAIENKYDKAYLVSGDGDFAEIVRYVIGLGKKVIAVAPPVGFAYHLKQVASGYLTLAYELDIGYLFLK